MDHSAPSRTDTGERLAPRSRRSPVAYVLRALRKDRVPDKLEDVLKEDCKVDPSLEKYLTAWKREAGRHDASTINGRIWTGHDISVERRTAWFSYFDYLLHKLSSKEANNRRLLCILAIDNREEKNPIKNMIHLRRGFATLTASDQMFPVFVIASIRKAWNLESTTNKAITQMVQLSTPELPAWEAKLPSVINIEAPDALDITSHQCVSFELNWSNAMPEFISNIDTYVWQQHCAPPQLEYARICVMPPESEDGLSRGILIVVKSQSVLEALRTSIEVVRKRTGCRQINDGSLESHLVALSGVSLMIREDLITFISASHARFDKMLYELRKDPSIGRLNYLQHCEDYLVATARATVAFGNSISLLRRAVETSTTASQPFSRTTVDCLALLSDITLDAKYLAQTCIDSSTRTQPLRAALTEQLTYRGKWRTSAITLLVAIYVPLSFAASLFGMNLDGQPQLQPFNFTLPSNATWDSVNQIWAPQNLTLVGNTASPQNRSWPLKDFFYTALPLVVGTILIPWMGGTAIRAAAQLLAQTPRWLQRLSVVVFFLYLYYIYTWAPLVVEIFLGVMPCYFITATMLVKDARAVHIRRTYRAFAWLLSLSLQVLWQFIYFDSLPGLPAAAILGWVINATIYYWPSVRSMALKLRRIVQRQPREMTT